MSAGSGQSGGGGGGGGGGEESPAPNEPSSTASPSSNPPPVADGLTFIPAEVLFKGPFDRPSKTTITVVNQSPHSYVFKVLITQPRRYLVRPNYGLVAAGSSLEVKAEMRPLPPGGEALDALLATRQKLLFKWRQVVTSTHDSWSSSSSPASTKSSGENPSALFITSTTPITETGIYIRFEPQITPTPSGSKREGTESVPVGSAEKGSATPTGEGGAGSSPSGVRGRASSLAGAPATAIEEDPGGRFGGGLLAPFTSRPGMIIVLLIAILAALAYMLYLRLYGGDRSGAQDAASQRFLRRYIF